MLELKISGVVVQSIIKISKNGDFCEELSSENYFEAVSGTFCCYDHGAKASEAVQNIATDQKEIKIEIRSTSQMLVLCYDLLNSQDILSINISVKKDWFLGNLQSKLLRLHGKNGNN